MAMVDSLDMTGKTVLVTGGTKGVGRGIANVFLEHGAEVMVCGRNEPADLPAADGRTADFTTADVRDPDQVATLIAATVETFGTLDVAINNAGELPRHSSPARRRGSSPRSSR